MNLIKSWREARKHSIWCMLFNTQQHIKTVESSPEYDMLHHKGTRIIERCLDCNHILRDEFVRHCDCTHHPDEHDRNGICTRCKCNSLGYTTLQGRIIDARTKGTHFGVNEDV